MAVLTEPAAEPMVASAPMPAPDAIAPVAAATPIAPAAPIVPGADGRPAANGASKARRRPRTKRRTGRRLFQFDRGLGVRWIAGADEAGVDAWPARWPPPRSSSTWRRSASARSAR
jgi:hypothetical protein